MNVSDLNPYLGPRTTSVALYLADREIFEKYKSREESWPEFFHRFAQIAEQEFKREGVKP